MLQLFYKYVKTLTYFSGSLELENEKKKQNNLFELFLRAENERTFFQ